MNIVIVTVVIDVLSIIIAAIIIIIVIIIITIMDIVIISTISIIICVILIVIHNDIFTNVMMTISVVLSAFSSWSFSTFYSQTLPTACRMQIRPSCYIEDLLGWFLLLDRAPRFCGPVCSFRGITSDSLWQSRVLCS